MVWVKSRCLPRYSRLWFEASRSELRENQQLSPPGGRQNKLITSVFGGNHVGEHEGVSLTYKSWVEPREMWRNEARALIDGFRLFRFISSFCLSQFEWIFSIAL